MGLSKRVWLGDCITGVGHKCCICTQGAETINTLSMGCHGSQMTVQQTHHLRIWQTSNWCWRPSGHSLRPKMMLAIVAIEIASAALIHVMRQMPFSPLRHAVLIAVTAWANFFVLPVECKSLQKGASVCFACLEPAERRFLDTIQAQRYSSIWISTFQSSSKFRRMGQIFWL